MSFMFDLPITNARISGKMYPRALSHHSAKQDTSAHDQVLYRARKQEITTTR